MSSSAGKRWWVFLLVDRLFADVQREIEAVRRAELQNDGPVCLVWLQPRRVQAPFVHCWQGHHYWKIQGSFVLISAELLHCFSLFLFFLTLLFTRRLLHQLVSDVCWCKLNGGYVWHPKSGYYLQNNISLHIHKMLCLSFLILYFNLVSIVHLLPSILLPSFLLMPLVFTRPSLSADLFCSDRKLLRAFSRAERALPPLCCHLLSGLSARPLSTFRDQ